MDKESLHTKKSRIADYIRNFDPLMLTYLPFIGWFIPMSIRKDDEFYMFHAKQAFVFAAYVTSVSLVLYFLVYIFLPAWMDVPRFVLVMVIYFHYFLYAVICIMGTIMLNKGQRKNFPVIGVYVSRVSALLNL